MKFAVYSDDATKLQAGLLGLLCFEDSFADGAIFKALDGAKALDGLLSRLVADEQFKGKKGQALQVHTHGRIGIQRVLLVGGGARKDFALPELRAFGARVYKAAASAQVHVAAAAMP